MAEKNDFFQSKTVMDFNKDIERYHLGPLWHAIPDLDESYAEASGHSLLVEVGAPAR